MSDFLTTLFTSLAIGFVMSSAIGALLIHKIDDRTDLDIVKPFVNGIFVLLGLGFVCGAVALYLALYLYVN